jgi:hypothetical protein
MTQPRPSLMFNLGAFFGHIARAVRTDPSSAASAPQARVQEAVRESDGQRLTLRRTTIDEVLVEPLEPRRSPD